MRRNRGHDSENVPKPPRDVGRRFRCRRRLMSSLRGGVRCKTLAERTGCPYRMPRGLHWRLEAPRGGGARQAPLLATAVTCSEGAAGCRTDGPSSNAPSISCARHATWKSDSTGSYARHHNLALNPESGLGRGSCVLRTRLWEWVCVRACVCTGCVSSALSVLCVCGLCFGPVGDASMGP
jgi:hypothetical protein